MKHAGPGANNGWAVGPIEPLEKVEGMLDTHDGTKGKYRDDDLSFRYRMKSLWEIAGLYEVKDSSHFSSILGPGGEGELVQQFPT